MSKVTMPIYKKSKITLRTVMNSDNTQSVFYPKNSVLEIPNLNSTMSMPQPQGEVIDSTTPAISQEYMKCLIFDKEKTTHTKNFKQFESFEKYSPQISQRLRYPSLDRRAHV